MVGRQEGEGREVELIEISKVVQLLIVAKALV